MKQAWTAIILGATVDLAAAQMTPVGLWRNVDDKTGEAKVPFYSHHSARIVLPSPIRTNFAANESCGANFGFLGRDVWVASSFECFDVTMSGSPDPRRSDPNISTQKFKVGATLAAGVFSAF